MSETTEPTMLDLDEMANSINGFDQIAIKKAFGESLTTLGQGDATMFMHVLYFVHLRRQDETPGKGQGKKDEDAYEASLSMSLKALTEMFSVATDLDPSAESERDKDWAEFVIGCGLPFTVPQYMELTINQRAQAIEAARKRG